MAERQVNHGDIPYLIAMWWDEFYKNENIPLHAFRRRIESSINGHLFPADEVGMWEKRMREWEASKNPKTLESIFNQYGPHAERLPH